MKKFIHQLGLALLLIVSAKTSFSQFLFPPESEIVFPSLSVIDGETPPLPEIIYIPQPVAAAPLVQSVVSGPWHSSLTWNCGCIPDANEDVQIMPGHEVLITSNAACNSLFISPDATLSIQESEEITVLSLSGDWENSGMFEPNNSSVHMLSNEECSIIGETSFHQLRLLGLGSIHVLTGVEVNNL
ncbi:MAG: hypothetical protein AAF193_05930, partial [Bacteroidota bacterium]